VACPESEGIENSAGEKIKRQNSGLDVDSARQPASGTHAVPCKALLKRQPVKNLEEFGTGGEGVDGRFSTRWCPTVQS
jgi:hypothetical protein